MRRAEQHDLGLRLADGLLDATGDVRSGPQEAFVLTQHAVGRGRVEDPRLVPVRTEHRHSVGRQLVDEGLERALDPADARRVVVRDHEGVGDVHRG